MADLTQIGSTGAILLVCDKCGGLVMGRTKKKMKKCECPETERVTSETTEAALSASSKG